jgi:hypothetical protein
MVLNGTQSGRKRKQMVNDKQSAFDKIYRTNMWGYKSGGGSDPEFAQVWIDHVNALLAKQDIKTVVDVGCGDWRIGKHLNLQGKITLA